MTNSNTHPSAFNLYDLHSHTTASDGHLTPEQLVQRAIEMRVSALAITDHDTTDGLAAAAEFIAKLALPLQLVYGVEISTLWKNHEIHIIGLGIDTSSTAMVQLLSEQRLLRTIRAQKICLQLAQAHIQDSYVGAQGLAAGGAITRRHFARYLVQIGVADNMAQVFKKYLTKGKTGYVAPQWCSIEEAIDVIHQSGGQAVIAHPGRYNLTAKWLQRLLAHFTERSGDAMEVAQCQQTPYERSQLAKYAQKYRLLASQGSDFHQPCAWVELGRKLCLPGGVEPVWGDWSNQYGVSWPMP